MTERRLQRSDVKVGIFVLVALGVLIAGSLWIVGSSRFVGERLPYRILLQDSAGIEVGDRVRLAGVPVGRIQGVLLRAEEAWPVLVEVAIRAEVPVREDTSATIASSGLMGASFLQILPGSPTSPLLPPGGTIRGRASRSLEGTLAQVEAISGQLSGILEKTTDLMDQLSAELGPMMTHLNELLSEDNVEAFGGILASAQTTLDEVAPRVGPLLGRMDSLAGSLEKGVEGMPELSETVKTLVADLNTALGTDGARLAELLEAAEETLVSADDALSVIGDNRGVIEQTLRDLETTMANLSEFSQRVKQRPSSLIRNAPAPDRRPGQGAGEVSR